MATTCSCDVSRLGAEIRDRLNAKRSAHTGAIVAFDREAIRHLAGHPVWRRRILAALTEPPVNNGCDYEAMIRSVAQLGGAVLAGRGCFDATHGLNGVFRVMVSSCGHCRTDEPAMHLDPSRFSPESLVHVIADSFADWCLSRIPEPASKVLRPKEFARTPLPVGA
ncbi:hypothetical protein [Luteolibacter sp. Populi]|uniref:hypothetical protein n=1 Tax=Luteolibacter sp. Populi TaxID=3230487 RepID=UPI003465496A